MATLILKASPGSYIGGGYKKDYFNGSDGRLYDEYDIPWLTSRYGAPKTRKTKYGTSYYFNTGR